VTQEINIIASASKILDVLVRRGAVVGHGIKVHDLLSASGLSDSHFDQADTYLLQAGYVEGTLGGHDGFRWLTPAGIQCHQKRSWWQIIPRYLKEIATVITIIGGLVGLLKACGA